MGKSKARALKNRTCEECHQVKHYDPGTWRRAKKPNYAPITVCPECADKLFKKGYQVYSV